MILLLAPEKLVSSTLLAEWETSLSEPIVLFTANGDESYRTLITSWRNKPFKKVKFFTDYANNDLIELRALELHQEKPITKIIPMAEADLIRAARLREKLNISGQSVKNALIFRNKVKMKEYAKSLGIAVPRFLIIKDTLDLLDFIEIVGYPVVIKPIMGRGSLHTFLIKNKIELEAKLNSGFISNTSRYTDLLVEEYIDGEIYHIDGLQTKNKIRTLSVSKYVNNCLDFVNGSYLGSYTLEEKNPLNIQLLEYTHDLVSRVFLLPENALMHLEVFVDRQDKLWFCEIACRIGGNGINDEVKLRHGVDIKLEYIRAECGLEPINNISRDTGKISARLLIPPRSGELLSIPQNCPDMEVLRYQSRGILGKCYEKMQMSNNEIANFLFTGDNEFAVQKKLKQLVAWFSKIHFGSQL